MNLELEERRVLLGLRVLLDQEESQEAEENPAHKENQDLLAPLVLEDLPVPLDLQGKLDNLALLDLEENRDHEAKLEHLDLQDNEVKLDQLVLLENVENLDPLDLKVLLDHQEHVERPVKQDNEERLALPDLLASVANQVCLI